MNAVGEKVAEAQISHVLKCINNPNIIGCTVRTTGMKYLIIFVEGDIEAQGFLAFDSLLQEQILNMRAKSQEDWDFGHGVFAFLHTISSKESRTRSK